ncbi:hypothetical protein AB1L07_26520 [Niallia alba]|uniref:DUF6932 family protein n=1 Tax=Niallia alba TaxID=2729105 RepID=UPI0039A1DCC7
MQGFTDNGNLFPGIHEYTIEKFENQFVTGFPSSQNRLPIYQNFCIWISKLVNIKSPSQLWLDGSYLTQKENPNDIDLVVFYYPEDITKDTAPKIKELINVISRSYNCDAYLCYDFSKLSDAERQAVPSKIAILETYWMGQFGFDRKRVPKGMVQLNQLEIEKLGGVGNGVSSRKN